MTSVKFVFYLTCLFLGEMAQTTVLKGFNSLHQDGGFLTAKTGDKLTLPCFYGDNSPVRLYWYKQTLVRKPQLISTFSLRDKSSSFYEEFKNNPRFTLDTEKGKTYLTITDLQTSDSATYYCIHCYFHTLDVSASTIVSVQDSVSNIPPLVHQSSSEIIQPGGSVTLNCTVHTGSCGGEHSVYWFKTSQEESHPGLIYTHGGRNDQCERKDDTQTHTCIYNLPMESPNLSHAGTYYCAVASCGHILFGDGTKLNMEDEGGSLVLVYFLSAALAFTTTLVVLLACTVYKMKKRSSFHSAEFPVRFSSSSRPNDEDEDCLHYATVSFNVADRSRRQRNKSRNECVYSSVRH